jgi:hypothetical protein
MIPQGKENDEICVRCLFKYDGKIECLRGVVLGYVEEKNKYKVKVNLDGHTKGIMMPRIYICSDLEDPIRYCDKVAKAYFSRLYADNLIKFNFYVTNMPTESLSSLEEAQRMKIKKMTGQIYYDENSMEMLIDEAQSDYWKTMNSIILKKHLNESINQLVPTELSVSMSKAKRNAPYFGLLDTEKGLDVIIDEGEK